MSISDLKNIFIVALLASAIVGCSAEPVVEAEEEAKSTKIEKVVESTSEEANKVVVIPTNSEGMTAEQLLAEIQGKVVNFEFDRSEVQADFYALLKMNADYMALTDSASVTIRGYADERGTPEYNLALGERRGIAVKDALVAQGISPSRINVISYGEENPVAVGHDDASWSQNRRVEFSY